MTSADTYVLSVEKGDSGEYETVVKWLFLEKS